eukprot:scaffold324649_cov91-Tisochrysis_lutea.AAC.1
MALSKSSTSLRNAPCRTRCAIVVSSNLIASIGHRASGISVTRSQPQATMLLSERIDPTRPGKTALVPLRHDEEGAPDGVIPTAKERDVGPAAAALPSPSSSKN